MYRLCKFFISDIVAGGNILQNGLFPIYREGGNAEHGILFAANGTCKTTLLSFLLNVFCPEKRRFVQYLQSDGDKAMEQYLIPGKPAIVLVDLMISGDPTIFENNPQEHLVLGQLLHRQIKTPEKIDRNFFIANSPELFEEIQAQWKTLSAQDHPYNAIRDFLQEKVQQSQTQKEWEDKLEDIGLDPWLVNRQVDFARSEGGIKDSFKFKSESEFLSFFLGCVSDLETARDLRENVSQTTKKMRDRPEKQKRLKAVYLLKQRLSKFDETSRQWRNEKQELSLKKQQVGEAAHLLGKAKEIAGKREEDAKKEHDQVDSQREEFRKEKERAKANVLIIAAETRRIEQEQTENDLAQVQKKIEKGQQEEQALEAAELIARKRRYQEEADTKEKALLNANSEIAPLRKEINLKATQYHYWLDQEKTELNNSIEKAKEREKTISEEIVAAEKQLKKIEDVRGNLRDEITQLKTQIDSAKQAEKNLSLEPGETPAEGAARLEREITELQVDSDNLKQRIEELEEKSNSLNQDLHEKRELSYEKKIKLQNAEQAVTDEQKQRDQLLNDPVLQRVAGTDDFEPTNAVLTSRVDEAIERDKNKIEENQAKLYTLKESLRQLESIETLAVDHQTKKLIEYYITQGVSKAAIKPFPKYLSERYEEPETIANFLESDPGRFTGIMIANDEILNQVRSIPSPEWLHKPVVISQPCETDAIESIDHYVIRPKDSKVYSKNYIEQQKQKLREQQESLENDLKDLQTRLHSREESGKRLHAYQTIYPDKATINMLHDQVENLAEELRLIQRQITDLTETIDKKTKEKKQFEEKQREQEKEKSNRSNWRSQIENWLSLFGELQQWYQEKESKSQRKLEFDQKVEIQKELTKGLYKEKQSLTTKIELRKQKLKEWDSRENDVQPSNMDLSDELKQKALSMDWETLKKLYQEAVRCEEQMATKLGIETIRKELSGIEAELQQAITNLDQYQRNHHYPKEYAEMWAARNREERKERKERVKTMLVKQIEQKGRDEQKLEQKKKELERCDRQLNQHRNQGYQPTITNEELQTTNLAVLHQKYKNQENSCDEEHKRLGNRLPKLKAVWENMQNWHTAIKLGLESTSSYSPNWDSESPRKDWPELDKSNDRKENVEQMRTMIKELINSEKRVAERVHKTNSDMKKAFDHLTTGLLDETLKGLLPTIVDELLLHDSENLGNYSEEFIKKCEEVAQQLEGDLERSNKFRKTLIDMLLQNAQDNHQKLQEASNVKIPHNVFIYGGSSILKSGRRLDFSKYEDPFRKALENWLDELIQQERIPATNAKIGNMLGAEMLYRLLRSATAKDEFGIRLLKCDDIGNNYEPVGKDLGSGGEGLTTAVLLYSLLTSMRQKGRTNRNDERIPAFLIADNPLGVCNRSDFLDAQLKVANAMGIQCVYLTGINDRESLNLFDHRVAIRKSGKWLKIAEKKYEQLEIIEQNVEVAN